MLLKTKEAAEILGLSIWTLEKYASQDNKLPFDPVRIGRAVRWPKEKIIAYANGELTNDNGSMSDMPKKTGRQK